MDWQSQEPSTFWGELAPCEHVVQIYERDNVFLDSLEGFVSGGLRDGHSVIVIATDSHRAALDERLSARGVDLEHARARDQYIDVDAADALSEFMVNGWPDDSRFRESVTRLMFRARVGGRSVRAFGEMVALLWARGDNGATIRLEHLWHTLCLSQGFSLLCAYPKSGFTQDATASMREICATHSKVYVE